MLNKTVILCFFLAILCTRCCEEDQRLLQTAKGTHSQISQPDYLPSDSIQNFSSTSNDFQQSAFLYSNIGDYFSALNSFDKGLEPVFQEVYWDSINNFPVSAIEEIASQSSNCRLLIINEAHHISQHRLFTLLLLEKLKSRGFHYFGAETLSHSDSLLMKRGYPVKSSGYFITEPQYGNLIRSAIAIGYTVFPYEAANSNDPIQREIEQARNIIKILQDSTAKAVVLCGYSHLLEDGNLPEWVMAMAGRIKEMTGIDPITIDQVELSEHSSKRFENPFYRKQSFTDYCIWKSNGKTLPVCFRLDQKQSDFFVYHPRTRLKFGRPDWLFKYYKPIILKNDFRELNYPIIVKVFMEGEDVHFAIPVDVIEIKSKTEKITLALLDSRKYQVVIIDRLKKTIHFKLSTLIPSPKKY